MVSSSTPAVNSDGGSEDQNPLLVDKHDHFCASTDSRSRWFVTETALLAS